MERNKYNPEARGGGKGWAMLAVGVTAYDILAQETLSNAFRRGIESENKLVRAGVYGLGALTVAHLLDVVPERVDPIDSAARSLTRVKNAIIKSRG